MVPRGLPNLEQWDACFFVATTALHVANHAGCGLGVFCPGAPSAGRPLGVHPAP